MVPYDTQKQYDTFLEMEHFIIIVESTFYPWEPNPLSRNHCLVETTHLHHQKGPYDD